MLNFLNSPFYVSLAVFILSFIVFNYLSLKITKKKVLAVQLDINLKKHRKTFLIRSINKSIILGALPMVCATFIYVLLNKIYYSYAVDYAAQTLTIPYINFILFSLLTLVLIYKLYDFNLLIIKYFLILRNLFFIIIFTFFYFHDFNLLFNVNLQSEWINILVNLGIIYMCILACISLDKIEGLLSGISIGFYLYVCLIFANQNIISLSYFAMLLLILNTLSYFFVVFDLFKIRINKYGKLANGFNSFMIVYFIFMLSGKYHIQDSAVNNESMDIYLILFLIFFPIADFITKIIRRLINLKNPFIDDSTDIASIFFKIHLSNRLIISIISIFSFIYQTLVYSLFYVSDIIFLGNILTFAFYFLLLYYFILLFNYSKFVKKIRNIPGIRFLIYDNLVSIKRKEQNDNY